MTTATLGSPPKTPLAIAEGYVGLGLAVIPIPHKAKRPVLAGWESLRLSGLDLAEHFNGQPMNVGVLLGKPSGWLIDIDLDHRLAVELAPEFLPATPCVFGRKSNPGSHRLYRITAPADTKKFMLADDEAKSLGCKRMLVEFRSTGCQTVFPGSTHPNGERIEWEQKNEPRSIDPSELLAAIERLHQAVRQRLGLNEKATEKPRGGEAPKCATDGSREHKYARAALDDEANKVAGAAEGGRNDTLNTAALKMGGKIAAGWIDRSEVEVALLAAAETCGLTAKESRATIRSGIEAGLREPAVMPPSESTERKHAPTATAKNKLSLGPPAKDMDARYEGGRFLGQLSLDGMPRLRFWRGGFLLHKRSGGYKDVPNSEVRARVVLHLNLTYSQLSTSHTSDVVEQVKAQSLLDSDIEPPCWLGEPPVGAKDWRPQDTLVCKNGMVHLPDAAAGTTELLPLTPRLFTPSALDFDFVAQAPLPKEWLSFLSSLWNPTGHAAEWDLIDWSNADWGSIELLQEWMGYCLTADTSQQKIMLLVGPPRSGKGTLARVLGRLVGKENVAGPTLSSLSANFGLWPLVGKSLAIVSDARLGSRTDQAVVTERLLSISGEDTLTIDRKMLEPLTVKLPTRLMIVTNELPRLLDTSGALAARMLVLRFTRSFLGCEDEGLFGRLCGELPSILRWAIDGWLRLRERHHFVESATAASMKDDFADLSSPMGDFVRERCDLGPELRVACPWMREAYVAWTKARGRQVEIDDATFGRNLRAAVPSIERCRVRVTDGEESRREYIYVGIALKPGSD